MGKEEVVDRVECRKPRGLKTKRSARTEQVTMQRPIDHRRLFEQEQQTLNGVDLLMLDQMLNRRLAARLGRMNSGQLFKTLHGFYEVCVVHIAGNNLVPSRPRSHR
jgi:hypothetical protein